MSCNWFRHGFSEHNVNCTMPQIWACSDLFEMTPKPETSRCFWELHPNGDAAGTGSSAGGRRGEGWNGTQEAKSPNLGFLAGSRVWNLQNFLCWLYSCLCVCTTVLSDSSCERRQGSCMEGVEEFRCQCFASICTKYYSPAKTAELVGDNDFSFCDRTSVTFLAGYVVLFFIFSLSVIIAVVICIL